MIPQYAFEECPQEKELRGSSRTFIGPFVSSVACIWMRLRWSFRRPAKQFPTKFWMRHWIIEQLVDDSEEMTSSPEMLDMILTDFASLVATCSESGAITSTRLHERLHQSIASAEGDSSFSVVGEEENHVEDFAGIGVCFHGDVPEVEMSDGLVHVFHKTRDM